MTEPKLILTGEGKSTVSYRTRDLNMAAFLWLQRGAEVVGLEGAKGKDTIFFKFNLQLSEEELTKLQLDYANEKTAVEPLAFCERLNRLRDLLHSHRRGRTRSMKD